MTRRRVRSSQDPRAAVEYRPTRPRHRVPRSAVIAKPQKNTFLLIVFFGAFYAGSLWVTLAPIAGWLATRDWVETPATVLSASLKTVRGKNSTRQKIEARYEYEHGGQKHTSTQVFYALIGGPFDYRDRRKFDELQAARSAGGATQGMCPATSGFVGFCQPVVV